MELEASYWDLLPLEKICEIIANLTNLDDIVRYMQVSQNFAQAASHCVRVVDYPTKVQVSIEAISRLTNLQEIGDNILVTVKPENIDLLSALPALRKANFYLEGKLSQNLLPLLSRLDLNNTNFRIAGQNNFRMAGRVVGQNGSSYFQGNRFMVLHIFRTDAGEDKLVNSIIRDHPQLQYVDLNYNNSIPPERESKSPMSRLLRDFLREADFGLVDPTQSPSANNPPLSIYANRLANTGLVQVDRLRDIIGRFLLIYVRYNKLMRKERMWISDRLIDHYFKSTFSKLNDEHRRNNVNYPVINPDEPSFNDIGIAVSRLIYSPISPEELSDYDVPFPIDEQEIILIEQSINIASGVYANVGRRPNRKVQLYKTNGTQEEYP